MQKKKAVIGSILFFLLGPGVVVGLVPWLLTRWQLQKPLPYWVPAQVLGLLLIGAGLVVLGQLILMLYAAAVWIFTAVWVHWYEEPTLTRRFGPDYEAYKSAVPTWWPRLRPW